MKIAILNKYQGKVARGAETFVEELAKRLSRNHDVDVISNIDYVKIIKRKYDVIIPTNGRLQAVLIRLISWFTGARMVVSGQSGPGFDDKINLWTFPDVFVGLTKYQSSWAKKVNPFVKVETIPNGVDLERFTADDSRKDGEKTVLSVGAFTKEKRHELTIDAVSKLPNVKLLIVGSGGERKDEILNYGLKRLGVERFETMSVPYSEMPEIYKKANVLAFPTVVWESFGIVLLEAMASDLPVVATNDPIRAEIVGNAGILVNPENTDSYAAAIEAVLNRNWGTLLRKRAEEFTWDSIAEKYENLLKEITK